MYVCVGWRDTKNEFGAHPTVKVQQVKCRFTGIHGFWRRWGAARRVVSPSSTYLECCLLLRNTTISSQLICFLPIVSAHLRTAGVRTCIRLQRLSLWRRQTQVSGHCSETLPFLAELLEERQRRGGGQSGWCEITEHRWNTFCVRKEAVLTKESKLHAAKGDPNSKISHI